MFLLEIDKATGLHSETVGTVAELLMQKAWKEQTELSSLCRIVSIEDLESSGAMEDAVPVGSLNFCETALGRHILPLNVPSYLRDGYYTGRQVASGTKDDILSLFGKWNAKKLFVKSETAAKSGLTCVYTLEDFLKLPEDDYFASETIDLKAEWRCFVYKSRLLDVRRYAGPYDVPFLSCDIQYVKSVIRTIEAGSRQRLISYTLDVGMVEEQPTPVVIELHPFVACGLYGFSDPLILEMLTAAAAYVKGSDGHE